MRVPSPEAREAVRGDRDRGHGFALSTAVSALREGRMALGERSDLGLAFARVLYGIRHLPAAVLVFVTAGCGALLRRALARYGGNPFLQAFCAAVLAGLVGALAVRYELSSSLRLVAVCPCMVLVPGPHVLNGALDLIAGRVHLGGARLIYAGLVIVAIATGLLLGLAALGVSLAVEP